MTFVIEDIRIWTDREGADPALGCATWWRSMVDAETRIRAEYHAYGLTAQRGKIPDRHSPAFAS